MTGEIFIHIGPMFSGKTTKVIDEAVIAHKSGVSVLVIRPKLDNRDHRHYLINTHGGAHYDLKKLQVPLLVLKKFKDLPSATWQKAKLICIDEAQFFEPGIAKKIFQMYLAGKRVLVACLNLDWRGRPFAATQSLMSIPEAQIVSHWAICPICSKDNGIVKAFRIQKLDQQGKALKVSARAPRIEIGGADIYRSVCAECYLKSSINH